MTKRSTERYTTARKELLLSVRNNVADSRALPEQILDAIADGLADSLRDIDRRIREGDVGDELDDMRDDVKAEYDFIETARQRLRDWRDGHRKTL